MSVQLIGRAFYTPIAGNLKITLLALADEANDDGKGVFIGQKRLAEKVGISERQVRRNLQELRERGYVERLPERHEQYGTDQYEIVVSKLGRQSEAPDTLSAPRAAHAFAEALTGPPANPGTGHGRPVHTPPDTLSAPDTDDTPDRTPATGTTGHGLPPTREIPVSSTREEDLAPAKPSRSRDPLFEAVMQVSGIELHEIPPGARSLYNRKVEDLKKLGATPDEVRRRAANAWFKITPAALERHWAELANALPDRAKRADEIDWSRYDDEEDHGAAV